MQHLFLRNLKISRTLNVNSDYLFLFNNPKDLVSLRVLNSQMGFNKNFLTLCFLDVNKEKFKNLILDASPSSSQELRVRSGLFPDEPIVVYKQHTD